jgi:hypothetical protein
VRDRPRGFSALLFSGQIVSGAADYGPIGVVTVLLSYLIGLAGCLHLGPWRVACGTSAARSYFPLP